ncbi:FtsX-like permease family protein [Sphingobacterium detergens]|uniref:ABC-type lipoprotein release transport system permease subunit n=1 Tax=Sphingobacterium detergens TaxID=1145106 RepID=A0A420AJ32_SPHD1|nr:FtsX-like permease family protein [Sphingobacterium detergens]RKE44527.1 ABC-type lipoprotein release transport system permease subunit [Sphingobacterium detergens]
MIKLFLKTALRNLKRNPLNTAINILGLSLGFTVALVSTLWILKQFSFNRNHENYDSIYQVMLTGTFNNEKSTGPSTPVPLAKVIASDFTNEVQDITLVTNESNNLKVGDKKLNVDGFYAMGKFSELFSLKSVHGDISTPTAASTMIISESLANRLLGSTDVIGKTIQLNGKEQYNILGVFEDIPENSTFQGLAYILPFVDYLRKNEGIDESWSNCFFRTYGKIENPQNIPGLEQKLTNIFRTNLTDINPEILLHPMSKWNLYDSFKNGKNAGGQIQYVWMFAWISIFILLLASINFINLSTARSLKRGKEIGILKSVGVNRRQLIAGFLVESILSVSCAFLIALIVSTLLLPWINTITNTALHVPFTRLQFYLYSFLGILSIGVLAGLYPALFLSSFNPILALKGKMNIGKRGFNARKGMVIIQFAISIFLMIATYLVIKQLHYTKDRPIGYKSSNLVNITSTSQLISKNFEILRKELIGQRLIQEASLTSNFVNKLTLTGGGFNWQGNETKEGSIMGIFTIDENFAKTVQWNFLKGRNFSKDFKTDSTGVIINEAAAKFMGVTDLTSKQLSKRGINYTIIGIIQNTLSESPFKSITPTAYFLDFLPKNKITLRLNEQQDISQTMKAIAQQFNRFDPDLIFDYAFTDKEYAKQFEQMEMIKSLTSIFTGLAILISCLGLYALVAFLTEQREKEIGIRKVLGASEVGLWKLLCTEYLWLTLIGFLVAAPLAYLLMETWLDDYVYRISISWTVFALTGLTALGITLITVSYQAIKAALANPVITLRNE